MIPIGIESYRPVFFDKGGRKATSHNGEAISEKEYRDGGGGRLGGQLRGVLGAWIEETPRILIQHEMPDVFIVKVECPEEEIIRRLKEREERFSESELNETPSLKTYYSSKEVLEEPGNEELFSGSNPIVIIYNTHTKSINIQNEIENHNLKKIIGALK
jgi:hypothetical protein